MKFNMSDIVSKEVMVDVEVPAWLTSAGEWGALHSAIGLAANGQRGTAATVIIATIQRIRKEALDEALEGRVEAYIVGHQDGWGEACEVEEDFKPPAAGIGFVVKHTPVADARQPWSDMTDRDKVAFRQGVAKTIDLSVRVRNDPSLSEGPSVTAIAREVIDGDGDCDSSKLDALEAAWVIIANVDDGNGMGAGGVEHSNQTEEWRDAAARWRDTYYVPKAVIDGQQS